ncbi:MAG TPA: N-acetylmuramoyl-L-alanine amidase [Melioribacteraceae bacterium]|nr:N-acetylmuramoyl-L-alanine amidase [Melioribacteraceae bacterium]
MNRKILILIFVIFNVVLNAQNKVTLVIEGENKAFPISSFESNNLLYCSAKNIAMGLNCNYFYNKESGKLEIKFNNFNIKFTANNHFIIITDRRDNNQKVYQLAQSVKYVNDDLFIPLDYSLEYLSYAGGKPFNYDNINKTIMVGNLEKINVITKEKEEDTKVEDKKDSNIKYEISELNYKVKSNGTLVAIVTDKKGVKFSAKYQKDVLKVILSNVSISPNIIIHQAEAGIIKKTDFIGNENGGELIFELESGSYSAHDIFKDSESNNIILTIHNKKLKQVKKDENKLKDKWNFDIVVLDAGHGGKDAGAIGVTGVKEKDINLGIVLKVGKLIEQELPSVKVVYTRKTDKFVELYKRGKIANENNGKLFISVHCNSTPQKSEDARGFEVYLLRPGRTQEAINIAEFENSVIKYEEDPNRYQKLTDENFILVSMAQSSYMRYSEQFSDILNSTWKNELTIPSRGIKQAGFYVLVGASMPNVLVEAGFLSNRKDEAYLKSESGQNEIARTIFNSIKKYKEYYQKTMAEELN